MFRSLAPLLVFLALAGAPAAAQSTASPAVAGHIALPSEVIPTAYRLEVTPDAKALTFAGRAEIDVEVRTPTRAITLNAADLTFDKIELSGVAGTAEISFDPAQQTATFTFAEPASVGRHTLILTYAGKIYQQASGLFALDYVGATGQQRALFTQFENSDARRFMPSWDEPERKATFQLTVIAPNGQMAVSNMPVDHEQALPDGRRRIAFEATPRMSSYLLFLGLGDFERVHRMVDGVDVGVVVKRGDTASARYALDAEAQILPWYDAYFGVKYPLPKLDLIAGPGESQFFSAMENWGAIFSFESALLVDPRLATEGDRQNVYITTAHEMAHQWFGDLVTMNWWDDLWLNEGFASWMEDKVTDHFHPEWKVWLQSLIGKQSVMQIDSREGTHPIITPIADVLQAADAFDDITYVKGQAVIRMLETYVGEEAWRDGVRRYIRAHAYGNAVTDDLWKAMDEGAQRPITSIAHDFTLQAGVPMVVERSAACDGGHTRLGLAQDGYLIDPGSTNATRWRIPVVALAGAAPARGLIEGQASQPLTVAGCAPALINAGQTGYFRTAYTPAALAALEGGLAGLDPYDQLGLYNDTASLALVGREPMAAFLGLTARFGGFDPDPVVMAAVVGRLEALDHTWRGLPGQQRFRAFARKVVGPTASRLGWTPVAGESGNATLLRSEALRAMADFGDPAVVAEAARRFARYQGDPSSLDAAGRRTVLYVVAVHADPATWEAIHAMARAAKTQIERAQDYTLLGLAEDPDLARRALDLALSGEPQVTTAPSIVAAVSARHPQMAFDFVTARWKQIAPFLEPTTVAGAVPRLVSQASDPALIPRLDAFAAANIPASAHQEVEKAEATIRYLARIRAERLPEADAWLAAHGG